MLDDRKANQTTALELCRLIEPIAKLFGCHVALTGGCLYVEGDRKDIDLIFYRHGTSESFDVPALFARLQHAIGFGSCEPSLGNWWLARATWRGVAIDCFFPHLPGFHQRTGEPGKPTYVEPGTLLSF